METPYSLILFAANHHANVLHFLPIVACDICGNKVKAQQCCDTPSSHGEFFMCRNCCYNHRRAFAEESYTDLDRGHLQREKEIPPTSHNKSEEWDGLIW